MTIAKNKAKKAPPVKAGERLSAPMAAAGSFFKRNKFIILAFVIPFALAAIGFAAENIAPFGILKTIADQIGKTFGFENCNPNWTQPWGTQSVLVIDAWHQYFPFLDDLHDKLQSGGSLFWTWSVGMGTNFIALMAYYLMSPLNFLSVLFTESALLEYYAVATVIKIACAGMFTAIAFKIVFKKDGLSIVIAGILYALCSYNMGYYWNSMWLDAVAMFPLVFAGTICLLRDSKFKLFIISLALAVIFNYYIGYMICIAVFIIAIGYTISRFVSFKKSLKDLLRTLIASVSALLLTAPITVTAFLALQNCYPVDPSWTQKMNIGTNLNEVTASGIFDGVHQILGNTISFLDPTDRNGLPNVACGVFCLVMLAVFFCARKIRLPEKLFCLGTLLFLMASFIFRPLDYLWHGFHFPNELPYRFSFLFCFLMIYMAFRAFTLLQEGDYIDVSIGALVFGLLMFGYFILDVTKFNYENTGAAKDGSLFNSTAGYWTAALGVIMLALLFLFAFKVIDKKLLTGLIFCIVLGEMCATAVIGVDTVTSTSLSGYPKLESDVSAIVSQVDTWDEKDPDIDRMDFNDTHTINDGAINNTKGISMFNSMANVNTTRYAEYFGLGGWPQGNRYTYYETSPVTNVILNLKYMISRDGVSYDTKYMSEQLFSGGVRLFENTAYIPQGFVVEPSLQYIHVDDDTQYNGTVENPIENQIEWWQKATGIETPVYTRLSLAITGHSADVTYYENHHFYASPGESGGKTMKFSYYAPEDTVIVGYMKVDGAEDEAKFLINDNQTGSFSAKTPAITTFGYREKDTKISMTYTFNNNASGRVFCYALNQDVFDQGVEILRQNVLDATRATDTVLEGTINSTKSGLLYTSIPYEKGWHAKVDGEKVDIVVIGNGVCAVNITPGEHTVKFYYVPSGFTLGVVGFAVGLGILITLSILTGKKMKAKEKKPALASAALWLCDTEEPIDEEEKKSSPKTSSKNTLLKLKARIIAIDKGKSVESVYEELLEKESKKNSPKKASAKNGSKKKK